MPAWITLLCQTDGNHRARQQVVVDGERRDERLLDADTSAARDIRGRLPRGARRNGISVLVDQRDLGVLGELQDEILQDAILLPLQEPRLLQLGGDRGQNPDTTADVQFEVLTDAGAAETSNDPTGVRYRSVPDGGVVAVVAKPKPAPSGNGSQRTRAA